MVPSGGEHDVGRVRAHARARASRASSRAPSASWAKGRSGAPHGIARAILKSTRRELTAELGVGHHAKLRDRIWSEVTLLDHFEERAVLVEPVDLDPNEELVEVFDAALRDNAIEGFDIWLLHELATVATAEAAPLRRGRCGLTSPAVVEEVSRRRPEAARTIRRRAGKSLDRLAEYVGARTDEELLAAWRAAQALRCVDDQAGPQGPACFT